MFLRSFCSLLLVLEFFVFSCSRKPDETSQPATASQDPAIVFLGDSLTAGLGLAASDTVPALVEKKIKGAGKHYRVINAGRSGDTTAGGLERLSWYLRPEVGARIYVIGLGSNDAMRGLSLENMEKNLVEIIKRIRAFDPSAKIFLYEMKTFPNMGRSYAGSYERVFTRVASSEKIVLLPFPLKGVAAVPRLNQKDGIHPNEEGAKIVADNVWNSLKGHL